MLADTGQSGPQGGVLGWDGTGHCRQIERVADAEKRERKPGRACLSGHGGRMMPAESFGKALNAGWFQRTRGTETR